MRRWYWLGVKPVSRWFQNPRVAHSWQDSRFSRSPRASVSFWFFKTVTMDLALSASANLGQAKNPIESIRCSSSFAMKIIWAFVLWIEFVTRCKWVEKASSWVEIYTWNSKSAMGQSLFEDISAFYWMLDSLHSPKFLQHWRMRDGKHCVGMNDRQYALHMPESRFL